MIPITLAILVSTLSVIAANWVGRWTMRRQRDAEIRWAFRANAAFTERWLAGDADVLPSPPRKNGRASGCYGLTAFL